jgi:hypothetical protein
MPTLAQPPLEAAIADLSAGRVRPFDDVKPFDLILWITCDAVYHAGQVQLIKRSKIPSDTLGILHIFVAVVFSQELFFAQDLTVEQPNAGHEVNQ